MYKCIFTLLFLKKYGIIIYFLKAYYQDREIVWTKAERGFFFCRTALMIQSEDILQIIFGFI